MKKTIGFNNKKNIWTSKYDYESSNYASFDKRFFSCRKRVLPDDDIIAWEHGTNPANNNFYDSQYQSSIAVSFNDNPSQNKLYKTFSVEGTDNLQGAIHTFTTSETLQPNKTPLTISIGTVSNKGGILYGKVPNDPRIKNGVNMKFIGTTSLDTSLSPVSFGSDLYVFRSLFGNTAHINNDTKFAFLFEDSVAPEVIGLNGQISLVTSDTDYYNLKSGITSATPSQLASINQLNETNINENGMVFKATLDAVLALEDRIFGSGSGIISIFAITDPRLNGDFLRGQHAEVAINLGSDNFELYSLNLNYEPTDLAHSK